MAGVGPAARGGLTGEDRAGVAKRLFWVGLVVLGALAALGLREGK